jgi:hypothetical protein
MSTWREYAKTFYKSTKRELLNSGKVTTKKKDVYDALRVKFAKQSAGGEDHLREAVHTERAISAAEDLATKRRYQSATKPRIISHQKIKKSNLDFFEKFYKLTSQ